MANCSDGRNETVNADKRVTVRFSLAKEGPSIVEIISVGTADVAQHNRLIPILRHANMGSNSLRLINYRVSSDEYFLRKFYCS